MTRSVSAGWREVYAALSVPCPDDPVKTGEGPAVRIHPRRHAGATKLTMTTNQNPRRDDENVTDASTTNYGARPVDGGPVTFAQIRTGRFAKETVVGRGADAEVVVDEGVLELTLTVTEFENAADLLDRDMLSVVLCAKNIPQEDDSA